MRRFGVVVFLSLVLINSSNAAPNLINYQGTLTDANGVAVSNPSQVMTFQFYAGESGGALLWMEVQSVAIQDGRYNVLLGTGNAIDPSIFTGNDSVWLQVGIGSPPNLEILGPRQRLVSTPFAMNAATVASGSITSAELDASVVTLDQLDAICQQGESVTKTATGWGCQPSFQLNPGDILTVPCYDGPALTRNVAPCQSGTRQWNGAQSGDCVGQVLPVTETCDLIDNDCNGIVDDGCPSSVTPGISWQWQITSPLDLTPAVQLFIIDLFDATTAEIDQIHANGAAVSCQFSAGLYEDFRPDAGDFPVNVLGSSTPEGTRWLDISSASVQTIMAARMDLAVTKGCDSIVPLDVQNYLEPTGFVTSFDGQILYNTWLADTAHGLGLTIGLHNDLAQVAILEPFFDWALNESCFQYSECALLDSFGTAGKAVLGVEYSGDPAVYCPQANGLNYDWLQKNPGLDAFRFSCREFVQ